MMNSLLIVGLIISVVASILIADGRIFRTKHEIDKESDNPKGLNQPKMHHKLIETRMAQFGGVLLVLSFAMQLIAEIKK